MQRKPSNDGIESWILFYITIVIISLVPVGVYICRLIFFFKIKEEEKLQANLHTYIHKNKINI